MNENKTVVSKLNHLVTACCSYCDENAAYKEVGEPVADVWGNARAHVDYACTLHAHHWMGEDKVNQADIEALNLDILQTTS